MRVSILASCAAVALAMFAVPAVVMAQAQVIASTPAQDARVSKPKLVTLTFSEALQPSTAAASIVMTAMPGVANHGEMMIRNFTPSWSDDNKTLTLNLRQPLRAGSYDVRWQAAGADGRPLKGAVNFTVE